MTTLPEACLPGGPLTYYLHIFKNAGNTMREMLWRNRGQGEFIDEMVHGRLDQNGVPKTFDSEDHSIGQLRELIVDNAELLEYVTADLPYGIHRYLTRPVRYLALVREPVDRLTSYWYFAYKHRPRSAMWDTLESYDFDVRAAVEAGGLIQYSNDQTRCLLGSTSLVLGADDLEEAKELIRTRYELIGTVRRLPDFLAELGRRFGWAAPAPADLPRLNASDRSDASVLPARAIAAFAELNEVDAGLYRWVEREYLAGRS